MRDRPSFVASTLLALCASTFFACADSPPREGAKAPQAHAPSNDPLADDGKRYRIPIGTSPTRGPASALVTVVMFADFECPFCRRAAPTLDALLARYPNDVRLVWKNAPLTMHAYALPLARLALTARANGGDDAFWKAHDRIMSVRGDFTDEMYLRAGEDLGIAEKVSRDLALNANAFKADLDADDDIAEGALVEGTPHFFINGRRTSGARPLEHFVAIVESELARARVLEQKGVKRASVYDELQKTVEAVPAWEKVSIEAPPKDAPFRGSKDAPLIIQQFSDLECPFCRLAEESVERLLESFKGKIRIVWRDHPLPMHKHAQIAAEAAREALAQQGPSTYFRMQALLYEAQDTPEGYGDKALSGYAQKLSLNVPQFKAALQSHKHAPAIERDHDAAKAAKFDSAPTFVIGDYVISGAETYRRFEKRTKAALHERGVAGF